MIRKRDYCETEVRPIAGGNGDITFRHKFTQQEMFDKCRLGAELVIEPGHSIGMHAHENDMEFFYVLRGALVSIGEDGSEEPFEQGDMMLTGGGEKHALRNDGTETAVMLAIIVNDVSARK